MLDADKFFPFCGGDHDAGGARQSWDPAMMSSIVPKPFRAEKRSSPHRPLRRHLPRAATVQLLTHLDSGGKTHLDGNLARRNDDSQQGKIRISRS
jgi:hypothetical protein